MLGRSASVPPSWEGPMVGDVVQDAIAASFGGTQRELPLEYKKRSAEYWPERLTMPVGIAASGKDAVVPPQSVMRLAAVLKAIGRNPLQIYREDVEHVTQYADAKAVVEFAVNSKW